MDQVQVQEECTLVNEHEFHQIVKTITDTHDSLWDNSENYKSKFPKEEEHSATMFLKYLFYFFNEKIRTLREDNEELREFAVSQNHYLQSQMVANEAKKAILRNINYVNCKFGSICF